MSGGVERHAGVVGPGRASHRSSDESPMTSAPGHSPALLIVGIYLGTPVLIHGDLGGGWVDAQYPDHENPGRAHRKPKPHTFTGRGPDAWRGRMWRDQIRAIAEIPVGGAA